MRAVIQRVKSAAISVGGKEISRTGKGLIVYLGVKRGDGEDKCPLMAKKIANLRIFEDENGKMNLSCLQRGYEVMLVSQFTLCGDPMHGNRPSFTEAEEPVRANELYLTVKKCLEDMGLKVQTGEFGADMEVDNLGDGPVTIVVDY